MALTQWTEEEIDHVRRLASEGLSASQIASRIDRECSRNAIIGVATRNGIAFKRGRGKAPERARDSTEKDAKARADALRALNARRLRAARAEAAKQKAEFADNAKKPAALPSVIPMRFDEAIERGRCLWYCDDPFGPSGPAMPVCGAERSEIGGIQGRYCTRHIVAGTRERAAA